MGLEIQLIDAEYILLKVFLSPPTTPPEPASSCSCWVEEEEEGEARLWVYKVLCRGLRWIVS